MIFSNIKQFLDKYKKILYYIGFFLVLFIFSGDITFAQADAKVSTMADKIVEGGSAVLGVLGVLLGFATYLATLFLSPEWINGTIFGLDAKFKDVWILVSNVVYFIFAFILIWIAFMNIIGKTSDQYQLKQALPKFIVGVLIVPFSWFLVQFILSISSILTVAALSLPEETFSQYSEKIEKVSIPTFCTINLNKFGNSSAPKVTNDKGAKNTTDVEANVNDGWITCEDVDEKGNEVKDTAINSIFKIIGLYTYGILSFDSMDELINNFKGVDTETGKIKTVGNLAVQIIFDLLFVVVYAILIITLAFVLLIRGIYIWIYIMISPIFGLMYFFDKKEGGEGFFAKFNIKEFIALAMVPVYTMLALSFGLLFIYVVGEGLTKDGNSTLTNGEKVTVMGDTLVIGSFQLKIEGKIGSAEGKDITGFFKSMAGEGGNVLGVVGSLILKVFGIIVLRGALMAAMRTSEITKAITEPIHAFGQSVGKIASSAPGNIPVFGGVSAKGMKQFGNDYSAHIDQKSIKTGQFLNGKFGLDTKKTGAIANTGTVLKNIKKGEMTEAGLESMRKTMIEMGNVTNMTQQQDFKKLVDMMADKLNIEKSEYGSLSNKNNMAKALTLIDKAAENKGLKGTFLTKTNGGYGGGTVEPQDIDDDLKSTIDIKSKKTNNEIKLNIESRFFENNGLILKPGAIDNVARQVYREIGPNKLTEAEFKTALKEKFEDDDINKLIVKIEETILPEGVKLFKDK